VALTFDDGPHPVHTPQILEILRHHGARAAFFPLGRNAERHPDLVREMSAGGHTVGNHSYGHRRMFLAPAHQILREMADTSQIIADLTGQRPLFFRPPWGLGGWRSLRLASRLHMRTVLWSVSSKDWTRPGAERIMRRVLEKARDGSIVLLHDAKFDDPEEDRSQTVGALPEIIAGLRTRGLRPVSLAELLAHS
jgi:peptidoglycan/xylan/chitin deacetylase (PgdA/CDA1 family)